MTTTYQDIVRRVKHLRDDISWIADDVMSVGHLWAAFADDLQEAANALSGLSEAIARRADLASAGEGS